MSKILTLFLLIAFLCFVKRDINDIGKYIAIGGNEIDRFYFDLKIKFLEFPVLS